jgi:hypothetical protein
MSKQHYPPGWNEARVQRLIDHYENMSEDELLAEDEAARQAGTSHLAVPGASPTSNGAQRRKKGKQPKALSRAKRRKAKRAKSPSKT